MFLWNTFGRSLSAPDCKGSFEKNHKSLFKGKSIHASAGSAVLCTTGCGKSFQLPYNLEAGSYAIHQEGTPHVCSLDGPLIKPLHHRAGVSAANSSHYQAMPLVVLLQQYFSKTWLEHVTQRLSSQHRPDYRTIEITCAPVKVLVVDDDAVAHAGEVQAVSEAVGAAPGIHGCLAGGRQRRL